MHLPGMIQGPMPLMANLQSRSMNAGPSGPPSLLPATSTQRSSLDLAVAGSQASSLLTVLLPLLIWTEGHVCWVWGGRQTTGPNLSIFPKGKQCLGVETGLPASKQSGVWVVGIQGLKSEILGEGTWGHPGYSFDDV